VGPEWLRCHTILMLLIRTVRTIPGNSGNAPGQSGTRTSSPGNSGNAPGQSGTKPLSPGNSGNAPGQSGTKPLSPGPIAGLRGDLVTAVDVIGPSVALPVGIRSNASYRKLPTRSGVPRFVMSLCRQIDGGM
jgi:hypothetical protein